MEDELEGQGKWMRMSATSFIAVEHTAYIALGFLLSATALLALAGGALVLWDGLSDWSNTRTIFNVIDRLLFVLMLIEILHTVRASVRSGALTCEPFLVVGLIASIRRVLVITLQSSEAAKQGTLSDAAMRTFGASMIELCVLAVLILVMVGSIRLLQTRGKPLEV
jgi:uncharacterized membrane protein (DUF373 family)